MALIVSCRSGRTGSTLSADLQEWEAFRKAQAELGQPVNMSDWDKLQVQFAEWRQASAAAVEPTRTELV
ncbi:hypothetical protein J31TS4_15220 [Paenibacillus sp. J31TS4]|uniref:hypothetical protein n=1 Tax=Paenibacillus sp. J31TS4 TaxID=2807195 RepID=UPI001B28D328|nr:hypothetical protein [Paenibacillus sp. J31TS4]GIP38242.1 hypothetical protein J31TS4_15220 [Paenibacillus sp. J31TS4]